MEDNKEEFKTTIDNPAAKKVDVDLSSRFAKVAKTRGGTSFGDTTDVSHLDSKPTAFVDIDEVRGERQGTLEKYKNGALRMAGTATTSFLEGTVGALVGTTEALATGDATKVWNNKFGNALDSMNESLAEAAPIYYTKEQQESILNANFIPDKLFNGAGYMLGAIGSGYAGGRILGSLGKLAMAGKLTPKSLAAADAGSTLINSARGTRLATGAQEAAVGALSAHGESAAEARGARKGTYDKLVEKYVEKFGAEPQGEHLKEINRLSDAAGNVDYLTNLVVTGGTNMLQFGKVMTGGYKNESKAFWEIIRDRAGKYGTKELGKVGSLARTASPYTSGLVEETAQEGVQYGTEIGTADYYSRKFDKDEWDSVGESIQSVKDAFIGTINSKEGFESMLLGGILGAGGGVLHNDVKQKTKNTNQALQILNDTTLDSIVDKIGTAAALSSYEKDKAVALHNKDIFNFKNLEFDQFKTFVQSRVKYGQYENLIEELDEQRSLTDEQFKEKFGFPVDQPLPKSKEDIIREFKSKAQSIKDISESIETKFPYNNTNGILNDEEFGILKNQLFHTATTLDNVNKRVQEISGKVSMLGTPNNPIGIFNQSLAASNPDYLAQYVASIDNLIAEKKALNPLDTSLDSLESYKNDLVKLEDRRQKFIQHYNELQDPTTIKKAVDEVKDKAEAKTKPVVPEAPIAEEPVVEKTAEEVIAEKVIAGEELTEEEEVIAEEKKEEIEAIIEAKSEEIEEVEEEPETEEEAEELTVIKKPSSELVKGEKFFLEDKTGTRYHFEKTASGVKRLEVTKVDGSTPTQADINALFQFEANFNDAGLPPHVGQLGKVTKEKKAEKKEKEVKVEKEEVEELPISGEEATYDEDVQGGYTLAKTTSLLREELESMTELNGNQAANLRFLNYVDTFEGNPRDIKFKVVTSKQPEYADLIDSEEKAFLDANPDYIGVKFVVIDSKNNVVLDKESGLPLITSPLRKEVLSENKKTGGKSTYAISPKHFLRKKGVKEWKQGDEHPEFKKLWEAEVKKKNDFRARLESGEIKYLNIVERSPGVLDNEEADYISPAKSLFADDINRREDIDNPDTPRYFIPTTGKKGTKKQIITNKTNSTAASKPFGFLADGETRELNVGTLYAIKNGVFYPLTARNITEEEASNIAAAFSLLPKANKPELTVRNISNYVYLTDPNKNYGENTLYYDAASKTVHFGDKVIPASTAKDSAELKVFLKKRKRQADTTNLKKNDEVNTIIAGGKTGPKMSYYEFLFGEDAFTIKMNPAGERQVTNSYFVYDTVNPITQSIETVEETPLPKEDEGGAVISTDEAGLPEEVVSDVIDSTEGVEVEESPFHEDKDINKGTGEVIKPSEKSPTEYTPAEEKVITTIADSTTEEEVNPDEFDVDVDNLDLEEEQYRLAGSKRNYVLENIDKAKAWYNKQFADTDIRITKELIDGKAFGQFYKNITYLYERAEEGTLYHEAYHKVEEQYLTESEVVKLHEETEKIVGRKLSIKEGKELRAEDFRNYMLNGQKSILGQPVRNTFFRKLWRMIKSFVTGKKDIATVYEKLAGRGYSKDKKVRSSNEKLNRFGIFNETKSKEINDSITSILFDNLFSNKKTPAELIDSDNRAKLAGTAYKNVKVNISKKYLAISNKAKETGKLTAQEKELFSIYKHLVNNWEEVVKQHIKTINSLIDITIEEKKEKKEEGVAKEAETEESEDSSGEGEVEEITKGKGNEWDSSNEISTVSTASNNTKMLLATLKQRDRAGEEVKNSLGEAKLLEFNEAYTFLLRNLKGLSSINAMYDKIKELVSINPSMQSLVDRLPRPQDISNLNNHEVQLWLDFWQDFHKSESRGTLTILDKDTGEIYQVDANRHNLEERLKDVWKADLALSPYTIKSGAANTLDRKVTYIPDYRDINDDIKFLKNIGITFENWTTEELAEVIDEDKIDYIRELINEALDKGEAVNDLFVLADKTGKSKGNLTELLSLAAEKSTKVVELSYTNAEGKRIYPISLPDYHSLIADDINNSNTWEELIAVQPQLDSVSSKGSVWLDELFPVDKKTGLRGKKSGKSIMVDTIAGIRIEGDPESGEVITKADVATKFLQEFNDLFQTGKATVPRTSDKSTDKSVGITKDRTKPLVVDTSDIARVGFKAPKVREVFVGTIDKPGYFLAELERIQLFHTEGLGKKIDIYNKKGGTWTIFEDILSESTKKELAGYMTSNEVPTKAILDNVAKDVELFLEDIAIKGKYTTFDSVFQMMNKFKLIQNGKMVGVSNSISKNRSAETLARTFAVNHLIQTIEYHKVIAGDKAFYKDPFKRYSGIAATKKFCNNDSMINAHINKNRTVNEHNFEYEEGKEFRVEVIADSNVRSNVAHEYIAATEKRLKDSGIAEEVAKLEAQAIQSAYLTKKNKNDEEVGNMTEADAQAFSNPVFHRRMMIKAALWNFSKQEKQYQYEMAYMYVRLHERAILPKQEQLDKFGKDYSKYELSAESLAKYQAIVDKGNPEYIINIQKGQYFGAQSGDVANNLNAPTFHKYSIAPFTWRLVEGTNNEDRLLNMLENQIAYSVFESGVKVGARVDEKGNKPSFYDSEGNPNLLSSKELDSIVQVLPYKYLGIQVEIEAKAKEKVIFGTQFRKLFESNLFDNGEMQVPELGALHTKYIGLIKDLAEAEWTKLVKELGVELDENNNLKSMDVTKLVELLKKEGESRQLANNLIDALKVDSEGKLVYPIDSLVNRNKLESLMVGLVSSRVVRQKMPGDAMIQMANIGSEKKGKRTVGESNELKSYRVDPITGKTMPMQIKVSMNAQYKELLKKYGTIENVNEAIRLKQIPKEVLTLVGYRIPTQGLNSIEFMEIVGFTSDSQGNSIILPSEIVAKSGGDFDIDKLNIFRPNFKVINPNLSLEKFATDKLEGYAKAGSALTFKDKYTEDELLDIYDSIEDLNEDSAEGVIARLVDTYYKTVDTKVKKELEIRIAKGDNKQSKQNEIISTAKQMLEHEYMFEQLVTPNTTKDMDTTVDAVRYAEYLSTNPESPMTKKEFLEDLSNTVTSGTQELMVGHIMNQFRDFLGGKQAVGSDAVHITAHLLFQQAGTKMAKVNHQGEEIEINMLANTEGDISEQTSQNKTYSGKLNKSNLPENAVFVFGSNPIGYNGNPATGTGGAALIATTEFGVGQKEVMDNRLSDSGKAYGMTTVNYVKKDEGKYKTPEQIKENIEKMYAFAEQNPDKQFYVAYDGLNPSKKNLNGLTGAELAKLFASDSIPKNIVFEKAFDKLVRPSKNTGNVGAYLLGSRYNKNGKLISDIFSQIANLHLDAAKDPKYKDINLTQEVLSTAHFLNHLGVAEDTIIYFIKQPAILELLAAEKKILIDKLQKSEYVDHAKELGVKYAEAAGVEVNNMLNIITGVITKEVGEYNKITLGEEGTNDLLLANIAGNIDPKLQLQVIEDFVRYRDYSRNLGSFMKSVNYDTTRFKNLSSIQDRLDLVEGIAKGENRLFTISDYNDIMKHTIVGSFDKTRGTMSMYSHLFVTQDVEVKKVRKAIIEEVNPKGKLVERLPAMIDNDFIGYVTQRFGIYKGEKLYKHIDRLFKGDSSLAKQLEGLKGVLKDNYLIEQLQGILKEDIDNISIYARKLTKHESDVLTDLYRELREYDNVKVQDFIEDLTTFGILQSGLHNSPITFLSLIPNELYGDVTKNAIESYKLQHPKVKKALLDDFMVRFYIKNSNNSQIVPNARNYKGEEIKKNKNRFFSQVEETVTTKEKNEKGFFIKEKTGKVFLYKQGKPFSLAGVEFRKYGHRLQDFYLQNNDDYLESGIKPADDTTEPPKAPPVKPVAPTSEIKASAQSIENAKELLKTMTVDKIINQGLHQGLSEQELNELAEELTKSTDSKLDNVSDEDVEDLMNKCKE